MNFFKKLISGKGVVSKAFGVLRNSVDAMVFSKEEKAAVDIEKKKIQIELTKAEAEITASLAEAQKSVLVAEITGHSWFQRNWRPISMIVFLFLIVADVVGWLTLGCKEYSNGECTEFDENKVRYIYHVFQIGLGGYVIGRSAEKITKIWKDEG